METIIKAKCHKKINDTYFIVIKSQNKRQYLSKYKKGDNFITWKNNEIYLDLESLNKINETVNEFDSLISKLAIDKYEINDISINYSQNELNNYDFMIQENNSIRLLMNNHINEVLEKLIRTNNDLVNNDLEKNALYQLALNKKDILMQLGVKLFYDLLPQEQIKNLYPKLPEEYNKDYIIRVNDTLEYLLLAAGYKIAHRPAFAMKGSTRLCWTINPYTKCGVDAAKINNNLKKCELTIFEFAFTNWKIKVKT